MHFTLHFLWSFKIKTGLLVKVIFFQLLFVYLESTPRNIFGLKSAFLKQNNNSYNNIDHKYCVSGTCNIYFESMITLLHEKNGAS